MIFNRIHFEILFLLILVSACGNENAPDKVTIDAEERTTDIFQEEEVELSGEKIKNDDEQEPVSTSVPAPFYLVDTSFIQDPYAFGEMSGDNLLTSFPDASIVRKTVENPYTEGQVDTSITISIGRSVFGFYRLKEDEFFTGGVINDSEIKLKYDIAVGMSFKSLLSKFPALQNEAETSTIIQIGLLERTDYIEFVFEANTLTQIGCIAYFD